MKIFVQKLIKKQSNGKYLWSLRIPAFSLIELSLVLVIVGVMLGAIFKGQDLLDTAKVQSVINDFQHIKIAIHTYHDTYHYYPGDDPQASQRFGGVPSGDGNMIIDQSEAANVWIHMFKSSDFESEKAPSSAFGGQYTIVYKNDTDMNGHWILLSNPNEGGLLTPKQAQKIMSKIDGKGTAGTNANQGLLRVKNGNGSDGAPCVTNNIINMNNNNASCIVYMRL